MIKTLISSATAKDSSFLFIGSIISNLAGLIILVLLARLISQNEVGLFITALALSQLLADMFELGINPATLSFLSRDNNKKEIIQLSFIIKLCLIFVLLLGTVIFASPLAIFFFKNPLLIPYIQVSGLGASFLMLIAWSQNILQFERKFLAASILNTSTNIFRLLIIGVAFILGAREGLTIFLLFQLVLLLCLILFAKFFVRLLFPLKLKTTQLNPLLSFGLPIGLGFSIAALYSRLDQIMVFSIAGEKEAAVYGVASRLMLIIVYAVAAFNSAIVVRFASLEDKDFGNYFRKTWMVIFGFIGAIILGLVLAPVFLPLIFGKSYVASIVPLQILGIGIIFFVLSIPFNNAILYRKKRSYFSLILSLVALVATYFLLLKLIPLYQSTGAALAMSLVFLLQLLISAIYYWKLK